MATDGIEDLIPARGAVIFHSPLTDLNGLPAEIRAHGYTCQQAELGMGDTRNRELFGSLRDYTGHGTLPQVFIDGVFVGGLGETREHLAAQDGAGTRTALLTGYAGLLPFALGLGLVLAGWSEAGRTILVSYGAIILSFVGAVHWGLALSSRTDQRLTYAAGVVPALVGWAALLLPVLAGLLLLAAGLIGWRVFEGRVQHARFPDWFDRLRTHLTAGASGMLVLAAVIQIYSIGVR